MSCLIYLEFFYEIFYFDCLLPNMQIRPILTNKKHSDDECQIFLFID